MKQYLLICLCAVVLICFASCDKNVTVDKDTSAQITTESADNTSMTNVVSTTTYEETTAITQTPNIQMPSKNTVFNTENITRITLYAYYGQGTGSQVPSVNMTEIINWLGSFTVGEKAPEILAPGTNTYHVEIEYSDGTVIKEGLDVIVIGEDAYYINSGKRPDCFMDIISKASVE